MTVEPWEPVARGAIPAAESFTVEEALDLTASAVHPGWGEGEAMVPAVRFVMTRDEHKAALVAALEAGRAKVLDPVTRMPHQYPVGAMLERAVILPGELVRFARECLGIELAREAAESAQQAPSRAAETGEQRDARRLAAYRAAGYQVPKLRERWQGAGELAKQEGISRQAFTESLQRAAKRELEARRSGALDPRQLGMK